MGSRKKVLVFAEYGLVNGGENSWLAFAKQLLPRFQFVVACPKVSELSQRLDAIGIESCDWMLFNSTGERKAQHMIRAEMLEIVKEHRPDLIHANSLSTARLAGPVSTQAQIPCLGHLRDIVKLSKKAIADINGCQQLVAVSNATKEHHVAQGIHEQRCEVVYNGIDLEEFHRTKTTGGIHQELNLLPRTKLVLCVGQVGMRKGTDRAIETFKILSGRMDDLALILVGTRNSKKQEAVEFEENCRRITENDNTVFWLNRRTDVSTLMRESSLLLHAARQEPLGRVLLESLATGLPFVATDVGGTREIVPPEALSNSLLAAPFEVSRMAQMAEKFLQDDECHRQTQSVFRKFALSRFDVKENAEALARIYQRMTEQS